MAIIRNARRASVLVGALLACGCSGAAGQGGPTGGAGEEQPAAAPVAEEPAAEADTGLHESQPPTNKVGTASAGSLPRAVIRKVVGERISEITSCYERLALGSGEDLAGVVEVKFVVGVDGAVTMAAISSTTLHHEATERCIIDVIRGTRFPPPDGAGVVVVTYPFDLSFE